MTSKPSARTVGVGTALLLGLVTGGAGLAEVPLDTAGTVHAAQSQISINGTPLTGNTGLQHLAPGQTLSTATGNADLTLGRGATLRLGPGASVRMVAQDATRTEVSLQAGRINANLNAVPKGRLLLIDMPGGQVQMLANGLYSFNYAGDEVRVFDGEALAFPGDDLAANVKAVKIKSDHELTFTADHPHPEHFDRELAEADLLPWSPQEPEDAQADTSYGQYGGGTSSAGYGDTFYGDAGPYGGGYGKYGSLGLGFGYNYGGFGLPFGYGGGLGLGVGFGYGYGYGGLGFGGPFGFGSPFGYGPFGYGGYPYGGGLGFYGGFPVYGGGYGGGGVARPPLHRPGEGPIRNPGTGAYPIPRPGGRPFGGGRPTMPGRTFGGGRPAPSMGGFHGGSFGGGGFHGGGGGGGFHSGGGGHR